MHCMILYAQDQQTSGSILKCESRFGYNQSHNNSLNQEKKPADDTDTIGQKKQTIRFAQYPKSDTYVKYPESDNPVEEVSFVHCFYPDKKKVGHEPPTSCCTCS